MERYFLSQDQSSHWYVVPFACQDQWQSWRDLPEDDERSWEAPEFAVRVHGGQVTFTQPQVDGKPLFSLTEGHSSDCTCEECGQAWLEANYAPSWDSGRVRLG